MTENFEQGQAVASPPIRGLRVHLLGPVQLFVDGQALKPPKRSQTTRLLAYLLLRAGERLSRSAVAEELWPEDEPSRARFNLRHALHAINKLLPTPSDKTPWTIADRSRVAWNSDAATWVDVLALAAARESAEAGALEGDLLALLTAAETLYAGPLLPGLGDDWVMVARDRAAEDYAVVLEQLMLLHGDRQDLAAALATGHRLLAHDPLRESGHRLLMRVHVTRGDRAAALRHYERVTEQLREELGVQPQPETRELAEQIRAGAELSPTGKDAAAEAPRDVAWAPLPDDELAMVDGGGRVEAVRALLEGERLVTLTGPAGVGKSRLAAEVARMWSRAAGQPVAWCSLADVDEASWPATVRAAIGLGDPARPDGAEALAAGIAAAFGDTPGLLVLDDADDLLDALVPLIESLASAKPDLCVLVTSREALRMRGEARWPVPRLSRPGSTPSARDASRGPSESERLLLEAVRLARGGRALAPAERPLVQEVCVHLDGLPLALVGLAQQMAKDGPSAVAQELSTRVQSTLAAAHEAGWQRLSAAEQRLLRRLAVFERPATLAEIEALCADADASDVLPIPRSARPDADSEHVPPADVLDLMARLSARSWLEVEPGRPFRYTLLPTTRAWLLPRLEASGEGGLLVAARDAQRSGDAEDASA